MAQYEVKDTRVIRGMTEAGTPTVEYRVWIETKHGATGQMSIPESEWTKQNIKKVLKDYAVNLDLAFSLTDEERE
jgi:hypothetical protein